MTDTTWRLLIYRLPTEPSRHRVAVWRDLRRAGAVTLQQGTWAIPRGEVFDSALQRALDLIERAGSHAYVFDVVAPEAGIGKLEALFTAEREEEWGEFLSECDKVETELAGEVAKQKFTLAELDEEEQNQERLRRWFRELRGRDLFGAPSAPTAEQRLKECAEALEDFADRVFEARGR
jgi:hypothetical protein